MNINEIFDSLQGECDGFGGQGKPTTFIRLQGCNLPTPCSYCDTTKAFHPAAGIEMDINEIIEHINMIKVTITGGEPLAQYNDVAELTRKLIELRHPITIETNGSIQVTHHFPYCTPFNITNFHVREKRLRIVMDYKLPSSGMEKYMDMCAFTLLYPQDIIKFVIADDIDYTRMKELLTGEGAVWEAQVAISPVLDASGLDSAQGYERARKLARKMLNDPELLLGNVQFNLQLHKLLGVK